MICDDPQVYLIPKIVETSQRHCYEKEGCFGILYFHSEAKKEFGRCTFRQKMSDCFVEKKDSGPLGSELNCHALTIDYKAKL